MRLLADTRVVLWWLAGAHLDDAAAQAIADPRNEVLASAASAWEIAIKTALGKLDGGKAALGALADGLEFAPLPITMEHAVAAGALPAHHADPFDRMLVAQARLERAVLVTRDARLAAYDVDVLAA